MVNVTQPISTTWTIDYLGLIGDQTPPITDIPGDKRTYALTGLSNYTWYTFTLTTDPAWLADTVTLMPTDHLIYMPLVHSIP